MGQYQQWLYHREVDQQLRAQLELLEQELQHLQEQASLLGDVSSCLDNPIVQAVAMQQSAESLLVDTLESSDVEAFSTRLTGNGQPGEIVSPALFAWGHLPNLDTQEIHLQAAQFTNKEPETEVPANPHPEVTLLPEDMTTFINTHTLTVPRMHVLRPARPQAAAEQEIAPEDRTDYSIQRWRERWGRQASQHISPNQQEPGEDTAR